jgi:hypothetical protein
MSTLTLTPPDTITHELSFGGGLLKRGFWLYVWEITKPDTTKLYYVGRTGDSSSRNAQSPFNRMGQHLGFNKHGNPLRRYLEHKDIEPESCSFRLIAYGPVFEEAGSIEEHRLRRDKIGAMEKELADTMASAGYNVLNAVNCRIKVDKEIFACVLNAFSRQFPKLSNRMESHESR